MRAAAALLLPSEMTMLITTSLTRVSSAQRAIRSSRLHRVTLRVVRVGVRSVVFGLWQLLHGHHHRRRDGQAQL
jgi:hypothetical protein